MSPLSQIALSSISFQTRWNIHPFSTVTNKVRFPRMSPQNQPSVPPCLLLNPSECSFSIHSWILKICFLYFFLRFHLPVSPSSLALSKAATLSFSFLSHLDSGDGKMTLLFSCSSSAILIPLPFSLSLFQSCLLPTLHSIENTLMSLLLASWQMKWCIFSLYST